MKKTILILIMLFACFEAESQGQDSGGQKYASDWINTMLYLCRIDASNPPVVSRLAAYTGVIIYEAVNHDKQGNNLTTNYLNGYNNLPKSNSTLKYDKRVILVSAVSSLLPKIIKNFEERHQKVIDKQKNEHYEQLRGTIDEDEFLRSADFGAMLSDSLNLWIKEDNYIDIMTLVYNPELMAVNEFSWVKTKPMLKMVEPYWGELRRFVLNSEDECCVKFEIALDSSPDSDFDLMAKEVYDKSKSLTEEEKQIAIYWDDMPALGTPVGHWISIASEMIKTNKLSLEEAADVYLALGIAQGDAVQSCWYNKFKTNLVRPQTYIQSHYDNNWYSFIVTPQFPEYPSGHSVISSASAKILKHFFGNASFTDVHHVWYNGPTKEFSSFEQAAREAAISRLLGGIHFMPAITNGLKQGEMVGECVLKKLQLVK